MKIDNEIRPVSPDSRTWQNGFDHNIASRVGLINATVEAAGKVKKSLREQLEAEGVLGLISLIKALIQAGSPSKAELLEQSLELCGPMLADVIAELLEDFEGSDPLRDLWYPADDGCYHLIHETY